MYGYNEWMNEWRSEMDWGWGFLPRTREKKTSPVQVSQRSLNRHFIQMMNFVAVTSLMHRFRLRSPNCLILIPELSLVLQDLNAAGMKLLLLLTAKENFQYLKKKKWLWDKQLDESDFNDLVMVFRRCSKTKRSSMIKHTAVSVSLV